MLGSAITLLVFYQYLLNGSHLVYKHINMHIRTLNYLTLKNKFEFEFSGGSPRAPLDPRLVFVLQEPWRWVLTQ